MRQILHSANGREYLLIQVWLDAVDFEIGDHGEGNELAYFLGEPGACTDSRSVILPEGNWKLIGKASELSEIQAAEIVEYSNWSFPVEHKRFVDYAHPKDGKNKQDWKIGFRTPKESVASLCASHNLNRESTVILQREG